MHRFETTLEIIGINPFVFVPDKILDTLFKKAKKEKGPIPVCGMINKQAYRQTLVKYQGAWRLYINTMMLKDSPKRIGQVIRITIDFDPGDRTVQPHPGFLRALEKNKEAKSAFEKLTPSRQREIVRYIAHLKTEESVRKNIERAIGFLQGCNSFAGRNKL